MLTIIELITKILIIILKYKNLSTKSRLSIQFKYKGAYFYNNELKIL